MGRARLGLGRKLRPIKWFWQRGRRGYSDRDLWSFNSYLYGVLAQALADLVSNHLSYPCMITDEEWTKELQYAVEVCARLHADDYHEHDDWAERAAEDYVKIMTWLNRWMRHLWD